MLVKCSPIINTLAKESIDAWTYFISIKKIIDNGYVRDKTCIKRHQKKPVITMRIIIN